MTKRHISPAEVERDSQGYWTHPAMRAVDLETAADFSGWLREQDLEAWVMLMRDEDPALFLAGFDDEDWDASGWMRDRRPVMAGSWARCTITTMAPCVSSCVRRRPNGVM